MNGQSIAFPFLFMLAACSVPPQQAKEEVIVLPVVSVEALPLKLDKQIKVPALKPMPDMAPKSNKSKADSRCPPIDGETEQQRVIRKLDCLLERD